MNHSVSSSIIAKNLHVHLDRAEVDRFLQQSASRKRKSLQKSTTENDENMDFFENNPKRRATSAARRYKVANVLADIKVEGNDEEIDRKIEQTIKKKKEEVMTLMKIKNFLRLDCVLKLSYSEFYKNLRTVARTLDHLLESPDLRNFELLILVPSLISTVVNLSSVNVDERVRLKAKAVLAVVRKLAMASPDCLPDQNAMASYFAQSAKALRKNPQFDVQKFQW